MPLAVRPAPLPLPRVRVAVPVLRARLFLNAGLAVLGAALAWLVLDPGRGPAPPPSPLVAALDPAAVDRIRIEPAGGAEIRLARAHGRWWIEGRPRLPADPVRVERLLALAAVPVRRRFPAEPAGLARYGLAPPRARLRLGDLTIEIGTTDPVAGDRYLRLPPAPEVALAPDRFFTLAAAGRADFAHPAPLGPGARPVAFRLPGGAARWDGTRWRVEGLPDPGPDAMNAFAERWARARALAVRPYRSGDGWDGAARIEVEIAGGPPVRLDVARRAYGIVLGRPDLGLEYHFAREAGARLLAPGAQVPSASRDRPPT